MSNHKAGNLRTASPAVVKNFVHSQMDKGIAEGALKLGKKLPHKGERLRAHRIQYLHFAVVGKVGLIGNAVFVAGRQQLGKGPGHGVRMSGRVQLRNHPNAPHPRVLNHLLNVGGRVNVPLRVRPRGVDRREAGGNKGKRLVVDQMPVKNVHLVKTHCVQVGQQDLLREVVAGGVEEDAAVLEPGKVLYGGLVDEQMVTARTSITFMNQLTEGLQGAKAAPDGGRLEPGSVGLLDDGHLQTVRLVLALLRIATVYRAAALSISGYLQVNLLQDGLRGRRSKAVAV